MKERAKLRFLPTSKQEGFTSKATSSDNDTNPSVIVRELIQNSLDAAAHIGKPAQVDFVFDDMAVSEIPGIDAYRRAFDAALKTHGDVIPEAAEAQIERIRHSLTKTQIPVLRILDNGVGLDSRSMNALLSNGLTNKMGGRGQAGSYGLGHYTAFPASDLQYILYGGITKDGSRTMSGHAILASHSGDTEELLGQDGFLISGDPQKDIRERFCFPGYGSIPPVVSLALDRIERDHKHGAAVILLAFNKFREENDPADSILQAVSRHFYPVIRAGRLIVRTERGENIRELDDSSATEILRSGKKEVRRSSSDIISGSKAYAICQTIRRGERKEADTEFGTIRIHMRPAEPHESTRISLFRSGMFITDTVPLNRASNFGEYRRFNAVISIDSPGRGKDAEGFELIRQAEGVKHLSINKKRLPPSRKKSRFDKFFDEIRGLLKEMATKDDSDTYSPEGFMELEFPTDAERVPPGRPPRARTPSSNLRKFTPVPEQRELLPKGPRRKLDGRSPTKKVSKSPGRQVPVAATARRAGRTVQLVIRANEDVPNATLQLSEDQGADASCTNPLADKPFRTRLLGQQGSFVQELKIGPLKKEQRCGFDVELQHSAPDEAVLKVDVFSRKIHKPSGGGR